MTERASVHGFEVAEALEPTPPRAVRIDEVVRFAEYLEPSACASAAELERSATEVSDVAHHDRGLLRDAQRVAQRRVATGRCTRSVVSLLAAARRRSRANTTRRRLDVDGARGRVAMTATGRVR